MPKSFCNVWGYVRLGLEIGPSQDEGKKKGQIFAASVSGASKSIYMSKLFQPKTTKPEQPKVEPKAPTPTDAKPEVESDKPKLTLPTPAATPVLKEVLPPPAKGKDTAQAPPDPSTATSSDAKK